MDGVAVEYSYEVDSPSPFLSGSEYFLLDDLKEQAMNPLYSPAFLAYFRHGFPENWSTAIAGIQSQYVDFS